MGNDHLKWFGADSRKILIIGFDKYYFDIISKAISHKEIKVNEDIGFVSDNVYYKGLSLKLWYLSLTSRHLWRHHFLGTQGVIFVFSFRTKVVDRKITFEVLNVLNDKKISGVPVLVCVDRGNKDEFIVEKLKKEIGEKIEKSGNVRYLFFDFLSEMEELNVGLDWMKENMREMKG